MKKRGINRFVEFMGESFFPLVILVFWGLVIIVTWLCL